MLALEEYTHVIVSYSGGKDSLAVLLDLLERGVPKSKIELWHQHVDGAPGSPNFMDWPVTEAYVRATGEALGLPVRFQWKDGGFLGEMLRDNEKTKGVYYEDGDGAVQYCPPGASGKPGTRLKFPQVSADLSVRWCSPYLKIDVCARAITNDWRLDSAKVLVCTGERREESTARAKYKEWEEHRTTRARRRVDGWRPVIDWSEQKVWEVIRRHRIRPHPAYLLGWGRVSCMKCIFGDNDQWASARALDPAGVARIAEYEQQFKTTIKRGLNVIDAADRGRSFVGNADPELVALALGREYPADRIVLGPDEEWVLPAGAYKRCGGPT